MPELPVIILIFVPLLSVRVMVAPATAAPPFAVEYRVPPAVIFGLWPEPWHETQSWPVFMPVGPPLAAATQALVLALLLVLVLPPAPAEPEEADPVVPPAFERPPEPLPVVLATLVRPPDWPPGADVVAVVPPGADVVAAVLPPGADVAAAVLPAESTGAVAVEPPAELPTGLLSVAPAAACEPDSLFPPAAAVDPCPPPAPPVSTGVPIAPPKLGAASYFTTGTPVSSL